MPYTRRGMYRSTGSPPRRSEYDDNILRGNNREDVRLTRELAIFNRAQKVVLKDLGKETLFLKSKLENERKIVSLGLYAFGSKMHVRPLSPKRYKLFPNIKTLPERTMRPLKDDVYKRTTLPRVERSASSKWGRERLSLKSGSSRNDKESVHSNQSSPLRMASRFRARRQDSAVSRLSRISPTRKSAAMRNEKNRKSEEQQENEMEIKTEVETEIKPDTSRRGSLKERRDSLTERRGSIPKRRGSVTDYILPDLVVSPKQRVSRKSMKKKGDLSRERQ